MINPATDKLLPLIDIARRLGVHYQTVLGWHKAGELDAIRLGGKWYTTETALTEYGYREKVGQQADRSSVSSAESEPQTKAEFRRQQEIKRQHLQSLLNK